MAAFGDPAIVCQLLVVREGEAGPILVAVEIVGIDPSNPLRLHIRTRPMIGFRTGWRMSSQRSPFQCPSGFPSTLLGNSSRVGAPVLPRADVDVADDVATLPVQLRRAYADGVEHVDVVDFGLNVESILPPY